MNTEAASATCIHCWHFKMVPTNATNSGSYEVCCHCGTIRTTPIEMTTMTQPNHGPYLSFP